MTEKLKNEQRIGRTTFLVAWIVIGFIGIFIFHTLFSFVERIGTLDFQTDQQLWEFFFVIFSLIQFTIVGILQTIAIYRLWGIKIRHWWWVTPIGFAIASRLSSFIVELILSVLAEPPSLEIIIILGTTISVGVLGSMQAWLLKSYFNRAYLYVLVLLCTPLINVLIWSNAPQLLNLYNLLYAASTGLVLLWLDHITYERVDDQIMSRQPHD